jgi:hypothetical protein
VYVDFSIVINSCTQQSLPPGVNEPVVIEFLDETPPAIRDRDRLVLFELRSVVSAIDFGRAKNEKIHRRLFI